MLRTGILTPCAAGDVNQEIGILNTCAAELGGAEHAAGDEEAPEATHVELLDDEVGADS